MMPISDIDSSSAAFIAGLITSLHCVGMCGPLAFVLLPAKGDRVDVQIASSVYHATRIASYGVFGALAGAFGGHLRGFLHAGVVRWLPWLMVLFFIGMAFQWEQRLPRLAPMTRWTMALHSWATKRTRLQAAALIGLGTPLLPCGPLYFILAASILSGSALRGAEFMLAFALGTVPLLWLAQTQFHWVQTKLSAKWMGRLRVLLGLTVALAIAWRLRATLGLPGPSLDNFTCCH